MNEQDVTAGPRSRCWSLLTVEDRQYGGNTGYDDDPTRVYPYDSKVPNCKRISSGDIVLVRNREYAFGIAVIEDITVQKGQKENLKCPSCKTTKIKPRTTGAASIGGFERRIPGSNIGFLNITRMIVLLHW